MNPNRHLSVAALLTLGLALPMAVAAEEPKSPWKAGAEVSYARTSGNTSTETLAGKLEASYESNPNRVYGKAAGLYGKADGSVTANKYFLDGRYERVITDRLFALVTANFAKDHFSGYDYQAYVGPGIGFELVKTSNHSLKALLSLLYSYDRYSGGGQSHQSYAAAMGSLAYEWKITDTVKFKEVADGRVSLKDSNVYFLNSNTGLEVKLASNLALGLGYIVNYRNRLPSSDLRHTDSTFLTSLIVTF